MRTSPRATQARPPVGRFVLALVFVAALGVSATGPAFGQGYERRWSAEHHRYWRERHAEHRWRAYPYYGAAPPVYAPPSVVYPPAPSLGIHLFFPLDIR